MKLELAQNDLPRENINMMEQHAEKQSIGDADLALTVTPLIEGHMIRLPGTLCHYIILYDVDPYFKSKKKKK